MNQKRIPMLATVKKTNSLTAKTSTFCDPTPQLQPDPCSAKQLSLPYDVAPGEEAGQQWEGRVWLLRSF